MSAYDNSMLSDAHSCMRYFYFKHVRGWKKEGFDAATAFGSAWHAALDGIWARESLDQAMDRFIDEWARCGGQPAARLTPMQLASLGARVPGTAKLMLQAYREQNRRLIDTTTVLSVEHAFRVPLTDGVEYLGILDKVLDNGAEVTVLEHKSTGWSAAYGAGFHPAWLESWQLSSQTDGYLYAARIAFNRTAKLLIDAALVHKTKRLFQMIPIRRTVEALDEWLWGARSKAVEIEAHKAALPGLQDAAWLSAFPKTGATSGNCIRYQKLCPYFSICKVGGNPEQMHMPVGFKEERWDPEEAAQARG